MMIRIPLLLLLSACQLSSVAEAFHQPQPFLLSKQHVVRTTTTTTTTTTLPTQSSRQHHHHPSTCGCTSCCGRSLFVSSVSNRKRVVVASSTIPPSPNGAGDGPSLGPPSLDYAEVSRRYRRTVYTFSDWVKHRSTDRLLRNFTTIFQSGVFQQMVREVGLVTNVAAFVLLWNGLLVSGWDDLDGIHHAALSSLGSIQLPMMQLPLEPFTLSSPALALLLVFRTNTAYGRWDEARKGWGNIVNHSRNLLRCSAMARVALPIESSTTTTTSADAAATTAAAVEAANKLLVARQRRVADCVWAFARSLQRHLWGPDEDEANFQRDVYARLPKSMARGLIAANHKPNRAVYELSRAVQALSGATVATAKASPLDHVVIDYDEQAGEEVTVHNNGNIFLEPYHRLEIEGSIRAFCEAKGGCERIFSSPVPLVYTRHTTRFVTSWLLLLPLALYKPLGITWNHIGMIPSAAFIAFFLFGIEELSLQLEEPFSILPLDRITDGIGRASSDFTQWHEADVDKNTVNNNSMDVAVDVDVDGSFWKRLLRK